MWTMKLATRYVGALAMLLALVRIVQAGGIGWPEAVARLTEERSRAENCVAALKGHGSAEQVARGRLTFGGAKAHFDGMIAGLIIALSGAGEPRSLPSLEAELASGASDLAAFCRTVDELVPQTSGQKSWLGDALKEAITPITHSMVEAISTLYTNYRGDKAATRKTICTQLEAAKWPDFDEVKAAQ